MIASSERKPLGQLLLTRGLIKPEHLERALEEQKRSHHQKLLGEVLVELLVCSEDQICEALALADEVPYARINPRICDPKVIGLLPRAFLEKHQVLPLFLVANTLTVAVPEPANVFLLEEIERISGRTIQVVAATTRDIRATMQAYLSKEQVFVIDEIADEIAPADFMLIEPRAQADTQRQDAVRDATIIKLVNYCIFSAVKDRASDIHIEPGENLLRVRYRIDGRLSERLRPPYQMSGAIASRIKTMAGLNAAERRLPQEGNIHVMVQQRPIDLRISTMPGKLGEKVVIRIIDNDKANVNLEKLGFGYDTLKQWRKLISLSSGMLLVTGPTGSGKTSTLYASLAELNSNEVNICTVEDPVQYALAGINQFQVNESAGFAYPSALRSLLRQDPDVIMVGEMRDPETAKVVTQAALTGHMMLTTLHTSDAPSAVIRLLNLGIEPYLVGASLAGVLAQRLIRKLCQHCKEAYTPTINERRQLEKFAIHVETLYRPRGCEQCRNLGFTGRIGIYELLSMQDALIDRISHGAGLNEIRELSHTLGMKPLRLDGVEKVKAGITTLEEVYRVTA